MISTGYKHHELHADKVGDHMLYFVVNNQPTNVIVVCVIAQAQTG